MKTNRWLPVLVAILLFSGLGFAVPRVLNNAMLAESFTGEAASGSNSLAVLTNGSRTDFGAGASDHFSSDGTTVTAAGPLAGAAAITSIAGTGTGVTTLSGALSSQFTSVGTGADTTEDNLMTYTFLGNSMSANGKSVRVTAWGDGVSTADATTVRCYFGATVVLTRILTAAQANTWRAEFNVTRITATTQTASAVIVNGGTVVTTIQLNSAPAETLSGNVTIKCTGQRAVSSVANSVQQLGMLIEFFN